MRSISRIVLCLLPLVVVAGCASTNVTQQTPMVNKGMARPNRIWVYNFVANPADMPANSSIGGEVGTSSTLPTAEQIEEGRQLGALIAADLVADINAMGLSAVQAGPGTLPQVGDGVIRVIWSGPRWRRRRAFRHRIRLRNFGDGYGGRRIRSDAPRAGAN